MQGMHSHIVQHQVPACHCGAGTVQARLHRSCHRRHRRSLTAKAEAAPAAETHKSGQHHKAVYDIEAIKKILPHRWTVCIDLTA